MASNHQTTEVKRVQQSNRMAGRMVEQPLSTRWQEVWLSSQSPSERGAPPTTLTPGREGPQQNPSS
eukprot:8219133-Prorocentrum_lima.AAC.1